MPDDVLIGEMRMFAGNFAPSGFLLCNGAPLSIADYGLLYQVIGTTYGGDGISTFNLPDMRGRVPVHYSGIYPLGLAGGAEQVALLESNLPAHSHSVKASDKGGNDAPKGLAWGPGTSDCYHAAEQFMSQMSSLGISTAGKSMAHDNLSPFLCVNFIIAYAGQYPSPPNEQVLESGQPAVADGDVPYLSELRIFAFAFAPRGWAQCNGQQLPIGPNTAMYSLLGNTFGGDNKTYFNLPDFRGRTPMNWGSYLNLNYVWGQAGGEAQHALTVDEMPNHNHNASASSNTPDNSSPVGNNWASNTGYQVYGSNPVVTMAPQTLFTAGLGVPHQNMSPFLALNVCIAMTGIYPSKP